jgi:hypothetical protein
MPRWQLEMASRAAAVNRNADATAGRQWREMRARAR